MNRLLALVRRYPIASVALVIAIGAVSYLALTGRSPSPGAGVAPTPQVTRVTPAPTSPPVAAVTPTPPAPASPAPSPAAPQAAGRADPFTPLVKARVGGAPGLRPGALPPPPPLPPPLFPGPETSPAAPPTPVTTPAPPPPPRVSEGAQLIGVLGDTGRVAILRVGGQIYIVAQGETIQDKIRVELVDANEGLVVLIEDGQRFEVRFG